MQQLADSDELREAVTLMAGEWLTADDCVAAIEALRAPEGNEETMNIDDAISRAMRPKQDELREAASGIADDSRVHVVTLAGVELPGRVRDYWTAATRGGAVERGAVPVLCLTTDKDAEPLALLRLADLARLLSGEAVQVADEALPGQARPKRDAGEWQVHRQRVIQGKRRE